MDHSAFLNINSLSEEAKKELLIFYEYLMFKYNKENEKKNQKNLSSVLRGAIDKNRAKKLNEQLKNMRKEWETRDI